MWSMSPYECDDDTTPCPVADKRESPPPVTFSSCSSAAHAYTVRGQYGIFLELNIRNLDAATHRNAVRESYRENRNPQVCEYPECQQGCDFSRYMPELLVGMKSALTARTEVIEAPGLQLYRNLFWCVKGTSRSATLIT